MISLRSKCLTVVVKAGIEARVREARRAALMRAVHDRTIYD